MPSTSRDCQVSVCENIFLKMADIPFYSRWKMQHNFKIFSIKLHFDNISSKKCAFYFHNLCSVNVYDVQFVSYYKDFCRLVAMDFAITETTQLHVVRIIVFVLCIYLRCYVICVMLCNCSVMFFNKGTNRFQSTPGMN